MIQDGIKNCLHFSSPGTAPGGNDDILLFARVPIIERRICKREDWYGDEMTDSMLCAGLPQGGKDTCQVGEANNS